MTDTLSDLTEEKLVEDIAADICDTVSSLNGMAYSPAQWMGTARKAVKHFNYHSQREIPGNEIETLAEWLHDRYFHDAHTLAYKERRPEYQKSWINDAKEILASFVPKHEAQPADGDVTIHEIAREAILEFLPPDPRPDALVLRDFTRRQMIDIGHAVAEAIREYLSAQPAGEEVTLQTITEIIKNARSYESLDASEYAKDVVQALRPYLREPKHEAQPAGDVQLIDTKIFWAAYENANCPEHERPCSDTFRKAMDAALVGAPKRESGEDGKYYLKYLTKRQFDAALKVITEIEGDQS